MPTKTSSRLTKPIARKAKAATAFRIRVTVGDVIAIGPGKIALLEAIAKTGSITAGAKAVDMSYRRAWLLVDELNASLRSPAVSSATGGEHGGGSNVTPFGKKLFSLYREMEAKAATACAGEMNSLLKMLAKR